MSDNWQFLNVGAGGFLTGIDIAPDDTMVVRTDTYGAYLWNGSQWQQLVTATSMPTANLVPDLNSQGVYEIRIAPSNTNVLYMEYAGAVYRSDDKGQSWSATSFPLVTENPNDSYRVNGQKMAVDPNNPNVVYVGTPQDGLFVTTDGGASWQRVSGVPESAQDSNGLFPGITGIAFDPSSGVTGGKTNVIYSSSNGHGVYQSTDGGLTWSALGGGLHDVENAAISSNGSYYAVGNNDTELWRYTDGTWTKLLSGWIHAVTIDPFNSDRIVVAMPSGYLNESLDGGATWSGWNWNNQFSASDIPWLANAPANYMAIGGLIFDPLIPDKLWTSDGIGVWNSSVHNNLSDAPIVWNSQSLGIEQLVANDIIVPPGGHPILASWDRPFFQLDNPNQYPSFYGPVDGKFAAGWSLDYASSDPKFIVGIADWWGVEQSGYSTDGGKSWTPFPTMPAFAGETIGGSIAASTPSNVVWAPADGFQPYYTQDGGATWKPVVLPGVSDWKSFDWAYYLDAQLVTADRVLPNTFYLYFADHGVFRTSDGGTSWQQVFSGQISPWSFYNAKIESVPGEAGHLFFTGGQQGSASDPKPADEGFFYSTDGGVTWTEVANVREVETFGFGAPATPGGYPSIYIVGWVNGAYGIWQSNDDAQTWSQIGVFPTGNLDHIKTISGDPNIYGQVYVGFNGSGYAYLPALPNGDQTVTTDNTTVTLTASNETISVLGHNDTVTVVGSNNTINFLADNTSLKLTASDSGINIAGTNDVVTIAGSNNTTTIGSGDVAVAFTDGDNTVTLGNGTDSVSFASGTNTVNAAIGTTLHAGDSLTGGSGIDTLNLSGAGSFDLRTIALTGFEKLNLANNEAVTLNNVNLSVHGAGDDVVTLGTGQDIVAFDGAANSVNAVIGAGATLNVGDTLSGGSGGDTLNLSGSGSLDLRTTSVTGFENLNLGSNETVTLNNANLSVHGAGNDAVTLGSGATSVSFDGGTNSVNATIGAGATLQVGDTLAGGTDVDTLNLSGSGSFDFRSVGFSGFEKLNLGASETVTLNDASLAIHAAGNDVVTLGNGTTSVVFDGGTNTVNAVIGTTLHAGDSLTGGGGVDTLNLSGAGSFDLTPIALTGFEKLNLASNEAVTLNNANLSVHGAGNDAVTLGSGATSVSFDGGTNSVNATIGAGATLQVGDTLAGGTDVDTLNLSGSGSFDFRSVGFSGFEKLNLGASETVTLNDASLAIHAAGNDVVTLGNGTTSVVFDGGTNTVNAVIGTTLHAGDSLTGGGGVDTLNLSGVGSFDLTPIALTGFEKLNLASNEAVTLNNANLSVHGAGNDAVTLGSGATSVSFDGGTNSVNATVGAGATLQVGDTLAGGTDVDTLNLSGSGSFDFRSVGFSGFEKLNLGASETVTLNDVSLAIHAAGNDVVTLGNGTTSVVFDGGTNTVNAVIGTTLHAGDSLTGGGGVDTLNLSGAGSLDLTTITLTGFENLNLASNEAVTLNNANLSVHGAGNDVVTLGTGKDSVAFDGGANSVNAVIGAGVTLNAGDTLTGGRGSDTLNLSGSGSLDLRTVSLTGFENLNLGSNETVTLNNANLSVHGAGNDAVTLGTGATKVIFDSGSNTVNATIGTGGTLQPGDSLTGGSGTDTLRLTGKGAVDLNSFNFTGFDVVNTSAGQKVIFNGSSLTINGASGGGETFQFHANLGGTQTINNLTATGPSHDTIALDKPLASKAWLAKNVVASGSDVIIHDGSNTITVTQAKLIDVLHDIVFV